MRNGDEEKGAVKSNDSEKDKEITRKWQKYGREEKRIDEES